MMSAKGQHVVPNGNRWSVRSSGASKVAGTYRTQEEAENVARERAKTNGTELYIHGRDGRIRERNSFGKDPQSTKG
jgi:Uncharacterized protein conserved in bacteria (DUF2188)